MVTVEGSTKVLLGDLGQDELTHEPGKALAQHVGVFIAHELAQQLLKTHARLGRRGSSLVLSMQRFRRSCSPRWSAGQTCRRWSWKAAQTRAKLDVKAIEEVGWAVARWKHMRGRPGPQ